MRVVAVIPARMRSSRFPGKPLAQLCGRPMIQHVYEAATACADIDEAIVATCDEEIAAVARGFGARVIMTSPRHERAIDRVAEACATVDADVVVMVQGDEPMVTPSQIRAALEALKADPPVECTNLMAPINQEDEARDPNTIKVVTNLAGDALYMSRALIPLSRAASDAQPAWFKQVCVMALTRSALERFAALRSTPLEREESIDMLRFLEHGFRVRMVPTDVVTQAVDTPADLARVTTLMTAQAD